MNRKTLMEAEAEAEGWARQIAEARVEEARELADSIPDLMMEPEPEYTEEDQQRDIEFGRLECLRDKHERNLNRSDKEDAVFPQFEYLVDGILPTGEVHIIAGETGAGKSTWLFQFIDYWQREKPLMMGKTARKTKWLPYVILVNDRSKAGMLRTMQRMKLKPKQFPIYSLLAPKKKKDGTEETIEELFGQKTDLPEMIVTYIEKNPGLKVIFVEGFQIGGEGDTNSYSDSSSLMRKLNIICQKYNVTVICTTHIGKANAKAGMSDRTAILGSVSVPGMCETVIVLTKLKGGNVQLTAHPRNEKALTQFYKWTPDGQLQETEQEEEQSRFEQFLSYKDTGKVFTTDDIRLFYKKRFKVGEDVADNERRAAVKIGRVKPYESEGGKKEKSRWMKVDPNWNPEEDD